MEKKFETAEFEKLIQTRESQLAQFRNVPNSLEVVWQEEEKVILNNSVSTDIESALEAVSAVKQRIIWITEMEYAEINFHGILGTLLDRMDMIIHVGDQNPFEKLGKAAMNVASIEEALRMGWQHLDKDAYLIYAPAKTPEKTIVQRGEIFRTTVKKLWS